MEISLILIQSHQRMESLFLTQKNQEKLSVKIFLNIPLMAKNSKSTLKMATNVKSLIHRPLVNLNSIFQKY